MFVELLEFVRSAYLATCGRLFCDCIAEPIGALGAAEHWLFEGYIAALKKNWFAFNKGTCDLFSG